MVISPRARRYLVAAIYISLSTALLFCIQRAYALYRIPYIPLLNPVFPLPVEFDPIQSALIRGKIFDNLAAEN